MNAAGPDVSQALPKSGGRILGLDGLRAVSVLAVMLYHAREGWMRGGFLGVEVFFVISGFLITHLLAEEWRASQRINLLGFWRRRARRLLPVLVALVVALLLLGALVLGNRASQFRGDFLPSLFYYENWHQIRAGDSYFADQGLPLLRHLWSLAVEGQFYVVWPVAVLVLLKLFRGRRGGAAIASVLLGVASFVWAWKLRGTTETANGLNRVYLGTDTRAFGLLLGAALGLLLSPRVAGVGTVRGKASWIWDGLGVLGLAAMLILMRLVATDLSWMAPWGLGLADLATLLVISALILGRHLRRGLGLEILEWIGQRSYGLYLWHWPIFRLVAQEQVGPAWILLRVVLTFLVAELSFHVIEKPFRRGLRQRFRAPFQGAAPLRKAIAAATLLLWAGATLGACVTISRRPAYVDEVKASIDAGARALDDFSKNMETLPTPTPASPTPMVSTIHLKPLDLPSVEGLKITAIGDSVMKGAAPSLKEEGEKWLGDGGILINAEESRPFASALALVRTYRQQERLGDVVVIHLGTNNSAIRTSDFQRLAEELSDRRLVLFLTVHSSHEDACAEVNRELAKAVSGMPNARLLGWNLLAEIHPDAFYSDRTHLRPLGARFYAATILAEIARTPAVTSFHVADRKPAVEGPAVVHGTL